VHRLVCPVRAAGAVDAMSRPPCICTGPESCGVAGVWPAGQEQACSVCGVPGAAVVARCGATRCGHVHVAGDFLTVGARRRGELPAERPGPSGYVEPGPAAELDDDRPIRLLKRLEGDLAPTRKVGNIFKPATLCPPLPGITGNVHVVTGYAWKRPYKGRVIRLDRNAAFLSAAASVLVAHGPLEHTGPLNVFDPNRPGYYLIDAHPWAWRHLPNPLHNPRAAQVWVPAPTVQLLVALSGAGRWADVEIHDSYTARGARLNKWTDWVRDQRAGVITKHGKDSPRYTEFKTAYSKSITLMIGANDPGHGRKWECKAQRPDWAHAIHAQASASLWRAADACASATDDGPVALVNVDELHLPESAMSLVTDISQGGCPIRLDPSGLKLGTFKVKQ
jgi:hypothetical protein